MKGNPGDISALKFSKDNKDEEGRGAWVAQSVKHLPSAQLIITGSWDRAHHRAPCSVGSLLLPLPLLLPLLVLALSLK